MPGCDLSRVCGKGELGHLGCTSAASSDCFRESGGLFSSVNDPLFSADLRALGT